MSANETTTQEVRVRFADHSRHLTGVGTATHEDRFDRWHAAEIRRAKAEAWDEAFSAGWEECHEFHQCGNNNPELRDADTANPYQDWKDNAA